MKPEQTRTKSSFTAAAANSIASQANSLVFDRKMAAALDKIESAAKDGRFNVTLIISHDNKEENVATDILEELEYRGFSWSWHSTVGNQVGTNYIVYTKKYIVSW